MPRWVIFGHAFDFHPSVPVSPRSCLSTWFAQERLLDLPPDGTPVPVGGPDKATDSLPSSSPSTPTLLWKRFVEWTSKLATTVGHSLLRTNKGH